ncbi:hypothetical protein Tco_0904948 [Tanacetum coccineum]
MLDRECQKKKGKQITEMESEERKEVTIMEEDLVNSIFLDQLVKIGYVDFFDKDLVLSSSNISSLFFSQLRHQSKSSSSSNVEEIERGSVSLLLQLSKPITFFFGSGTSFAEFHLSEWLFLDYLVHYLNEPQVLVNLVYYSMVRDLKIDDKTTEFQGSWPLWVLPERVKFKENILIEEPEFGLMFVNEFRDPSFWRASDVHKLLLQDCSTLSQKKDSPFTEVELSE